MESRALQVLNAVVRNPYLNLGAGLVMFMSGLSETITELAGDGFALGAHHGMIVLGLLHALRSLSEVFEGLTHVREAEETVAVD